MTYKPRPLPAGWLGLLGVAQRYHVPPATVIFWFKSGVLHDVPTRRYGQNQRRIWEAEKLPTIETISARCNLLRVNPSPLENHA